MISSSTGIFSEASELNSKWFVRSSLRDQRMSPVCSTVPKYPLNRIITDPKI